MRHPPVRTAVFPVAGLGTRFLPATKASPKEMLIVVDKPLIQYAVEEAACAGIEKFIFVTSHGKEAIENHFDISSALEHMLERKGKKAELACLRSFQLKPGQAVFVRQQAPLGLGHAVWCARHMVGDQPFALILPDDLILSPKSCLAQMVDAYGQLGGNMMAVMDVKPEHVNRYGILDILKDDGLYVRVKGVVEKPAVGVAPSHVAIVGRYILQPEIFKVLECQEVGEGGEIQLTDSFPSLIQDMPFHGLRFAGQRFDCGSKEGWLEANIAFASARPDLKDHLFSAIKKHCQVE